MPCSPPSGRRPTTHHDRSQYRYVVFEAHSHDPSEGLAFLSRHPIAQAEAGWQGDSQPAEGGLRIHIRADDTPLSITNVHLGSSMVDILQRERQVTAIAEWIAARQEPGMLDLLCGDFNAYPGSSIHNFLLGQASLRGHSAQWFDLALYDAHRKGTDASPTLDFIRNPRWSQEHTIGVPARFDWILLRDCYPDPYPYIDRVELFGIEPTPIAQVVPSDHYGVFADIRMPWDTTARSRD